MRTWKTAFALALGLLTAASARADVRIKDLTDLEGARGNQLYGFGLVVGLAGTGGRSLFTQKVAVDMLEKLNVKSTIFAEIGPFGRPGSRLDVIVSSLDDAKSLQGGTLILTPLKGPDGEAYAVAQGPLSVGGFIFPGQSGGGVQKNHPTVGRIPSGGIIEKEAHGEVLNKGCLRLLVRDADFNTSRLIAKAINDRYPDTALSLDGGAVQVKLPPDRCANPMSFISEIGLLRVTPDGPARVVINERTGTVVVGQQVQISATAVAHGNLSIVTVEDYNVTQPAPFSRGVTTVTPQSSVNVVEPRNRLIVVPKALTVADLARALNALGVSPRDLISIFQCLKEDGALHAELIIM
jgi:flagellar P-ring protein precursor FlgI